MCGRQTIRLFTTRPTICNPRQSQTATYRSNQPPISHQRLWVRSISAIRLGWGGPIAARLTPRDSNRAFKDAGIFWPDQWNFPRNESAVTTHWLGPRPSRHPVANDLFAGRRCAHEHVASIWRRASRAPDERLAHGGIAGITVQHE